jgi:hypothetical protein
VAAIHPERVVPEALPNRGLVLTGVVAASHPAGASWEADLRVGEATITCRLPDKPPAPDAEFTVTALDPPYFSSDGSAAPAEDGITRPEQVHQ